MAALANMVRGERIGAGGRRGALTERDLEISRWLDRLGAASLESIRVRFGLGQSQAYRRLQVLRESGLLRSQRLLVDRPALYMPAGRALRPGSFMHTLIAADFVAGRERLGGRIITEVELRRERSAVPALPAWVDGAQREVVLRCRRIPDAIELLASDGLEAIEIELSSKGRARRRHALGRPGLLPRALAAARPSPVRSRVTSRSNSAIEAKKWKISRRDDELVALARDPQGLIEFGAAGELAAGLVDE